MEKIQGEEWIGIDLFSTSKGSLYLAKSNLDVQILTEGFPWAKHSLYVNRFYRAPEVGNVD